MVDRSSYSQPATDPIAGPPLLDQMVKAIVETAQPEKVILFGSRARETAHDKSDYDFLVVDAKPFDRNRSRRKAIAKISRVLASFRVPTDVLLHSTDEVTQWSHSRNHVIGRAMREGKVLYERS